jgi:CubicO group peptidase (beta-lactamase class C family)
MSRPVSEPLMRELTFPHADAAPWPTASPKEAGFDPARLLKAVQFAEAHPSPWSHDLAAVLANSYFEPPPWNETLGLVRPRGDANGLITRDGRLVTRWGDTRQVDMTFSIAKSYLSILAGVAHDRGLLPDPDEPVGKRVDDGGFAPPHNDAITWSHLLQQTSEWEGTLWDKPDVVDRYRNLTTEGGPYAKKGLPRPLQAPGTYWEYNDVRVNRLSLALLRLFRRPLPEIFADAVMKPIGASTSWHWEGYRNSTVEIDGRTMISVPGGSHWGGGVFIHAEDQARVGLMMLAEGDWHGRRILSKQWVDRSKRPCPINPTYGYLWWLNTDRGYYANASPQSFFAIGAGGNCTWIDPNSGIVAVMRWLDPAATSEFIGLAAHALVQ